MSQARIHKPRNQIGLRNKKILCLPASRSTSCAIISQRCKHPKRGTTRVDLQSNETSSLTLRIPVTDISGAPRLGSEWRALCFGHTHLASSLPQHQGGRPTEKSPGQAVSSKPFFSFLEEEGATPSSTQLVIGDPFRTPPPPGQPQWCTQRSVVVTWWKVELPVECCCCRNVPPSPPSQHVVTTPPPLPT